MENKLRPCPFCGEKETLESGDNWECADGYVHCYACGGHISADGSSEEREELAIKKWNTRAD